jgi:hypothetical protein
MLLSCGVQNTFADSVVTDVTRDNISDLSIILTIRSELSKGTVWFNVVVAAGSAGLTDCTKGRLELRRDDKVLMGGNIEELRLDDGRREFRFGVHTELIDAAEFMFQNFDCRMPSFDGYRVRLVDFVEKE